MNRSKTAATVAGVVVAAVLLFLVVIPQIRIYNAAKSAEYVGKPAQYYTDFSGKVDNPLKITNGHISLDISSSYSPIRLEGELHDKARVYKDNSKGVMLTFADNLGDAMDYTNEASLTGASPMLKSVYKSFMRGVKRFGYGTPDCAYNSLRCIYLLDDSDYSFWDRDRCVAYAVLAEMKKAVGSDYDYVYIYERDDIRGFISVEETPTKDTMYNIHLEIYTTDDLNTVSTVIMCVDTLGEAFAAMNTAKPV